MYVVTPAERMHSFGHQDVVTRGSGRARWIAPVVDSAAQSASSAASSIMRVTRDALLRQLRRQPDLQIALQAGFKNNLRQKLSKANERTLAETRN